MAKAKSVNGKELNFEAKLWQAADKMRNNMDAAEYKHVEIESVDRGFISQIFGSFDEIYRDDVKPY